jgi:hypothetical protein
MVVAWPLPDVVRLLQPPSANAMGQDVGPTAMGYGQCQSCGFWGPGRYKFFLRIDIKILT